MTKRHVGRHLAAIGLSMLLASPVSLPAASAESVRAPSAYEIMQRVDAREQGRDQVARAVWRLVAASGRVRERRTRFLRKVEDGASARLLSRWLLVFESPPDVRDTAFLVWNPRVRAEGAEQWMYLAGLRKVRRIAGSVRGTAFMGTDFAFEDLSERAAEQDDHLLLREEELEGVSHYVIESTPKPGSSVYARRIQWVRPERWTLARIDFYRRSDWPEKSLRLAWQRSGEVWVWKRLEMESRRTGHRTVIDVEEVRIDTGLGEELFQPGALARASQ